MAQAVSPHSDMVQARQSDGINVIFDESPASSRSGSWGSCSSSRSTQRSRGRGVHKRCFRSPSSSSSSSSSSSRRSTSRSSRSRSHPRCHRHSSRCRCKNHYRYQRGHHHRRRSPSYYRSHSRSHSRSPSVDRYHQRRHNWLQSRSSSYRSRRARCQLSRSPPRSFRSRQNCKSSHCSNALSVEEKQHLLEVARQNAMKNLGVQKLDLPKSVKPILRPQFVTSDQSFEGPETRVWQNSENIFRNAEEETHPQRPKLSPKRGISFSAKNSVAKPTVGMQPCAKVTSLVDSVESKKPYGHWIPVKSARH